MTNIISFTQYKSRKGVIDMLDIQNEKKLEIEKKVHDILTKENLSPLSSVDIVPLVNKYGFCVQKADLPIDTTGYLAVNDNAPVTEDSEHHKLIVVNTKFTNNDNDDNVILKKSRFITAHEFGHYILHKKQSESLYAHRDNDKRDSLIELEADYFARSILMPANSFSKINELIDSIGQLNAMNSSELTNFKIDFLSRFFKVTKNKVKKRMGDIEVLSLMNN